MPRVTRPATARWQEDALLAHPRQAALLTAGVVAVTAVVFALAADHGTLARIQRLDDAWLRLMISGRAQRLLCAAVALSIIAVTVIRKAFLRQTVGPVRLRRSPRRRLRHRCRVPARPGSRGLPRAPWRPAPPARHKRRRPRCPGGSACPAYGCASCPAQAGTGG